MSHAPGGHGGGHGDEADNKYIAIFISVLALVSGHRRDVRQRRADQLHRLQCRGVEPVGLLSGQDHPPDDAENGDRADGSRRATRQGSGDEADLGEARCGLESRRRRAISRNRSRTAKARAARSCRHGPSRPARSGISSRRSIITTRSPRPHSRSRIVLASVYLITHVVYMLWGAGLLAAIGVLLHDHWLLFPECHSSLLSGVAMMNGSEMARSMQWRSARACSALSPSA